MKMDSELGQKLEEAGADLSMISRYQRYQAIGDKLGQERLLARCCRMKKEELDKKREQLACLDYMIAKLEKDYG